jgi:hypothetical protein
MIWYDTIRYDMIQYDMIFINCNWVSTQWQRSVDFYENRKDTAIYTKVERIQEHRIRKIESRTCKTREQTKNEYFFKKN